MVADDRQLSATLERIDWFQRQVVHLRQSVPNVANVANYRAASAGFVAEIDRMQREAREYLSLHPSEFADAA